MRNLFATTTLAAIGTVVLIAAGCSGLTPEPEKTGEKPPKSVTTMELRKSSPSYQHHTTAGVAPWKSERIGFELAGRVVQVIEPNEMVAGPRVYNEQALKELHNETSRSQPETLEQDQRLLARIEPERYKIAVMAAKADLDVVARRLDANKIATRGYEEFRQQLDSQLQPGESSEDQGQLVAAIETAMAEKKLAELEFNRAERLGLSNALSKAEVDTARTRLQTAKSRVSSANAELDQALSEEQALRAQVKQAEQRLAEAERNLKNTKLYSSFPGQVAEVHVVPGTYVKEGDPVVTLQMVDPMLVEFEVTAERSRRYRRGDTLELTVTGIDGVEKPHTGMVYTVDTLADPNTRTFTVSLLVRNDLVTEFDDVPSEQVTAGQIVTTRHMYPLNLGPIVTGEKRLLVEKRCLHLINGKEYVWKIKNRSWGEVSYSGDHQLTVERVEVVSHDMVIPFLGNWEFVPIEFVDSSQVVLEKDLITGRLNIENIDSNGKFDRMSSDPQLLSDWNVTQVILKQTRWQLRAGDTVRVSLIPEQQNDGFFVPMRTVRHENGESFVHVIDELDSKHVARRVSVEVLAEDSVDNDTLMLCIKAKSKNNDAGNTEPPIESRNVLADGVSIVVGGTHYLNDGDLVQIVNAKRESGGGR